MQNMRSLYPNAVLIQPSCYALIFNHTMGANLCGASEASTPSKGTPPVRKPPKKKEKKQLASLSPEVLQLAHKLCKDSKVISTNGEKLLDLAFNEDQLQRLAKVAVQGLVNAQKQRETNKEKEVVERILSLPDIKGRVERQQGKEGVLFYDDIAQMVQKQLNVERQDLSHGCQSRIYNIIAQLKSHQLQKRHGWHQVRHDCQIVRKEPSFWLSEFRGVRNLDELVRMEELAEVSRRVGEQSNLLFQQLEKETDSIVKMLSNTQERQWKYNLEIGEVLEVAKLAREATDYNHHGVRRLTTYLRQSIFNLSSDKKDFRQIEQLMKAAISELMKAYPPGKGLEKHQKQEKEALYELQMKKENKGKFSHKAIALTGSSEEKAQQIQDHVMYHARLAQRYQSRFEEMISKTCLKLAVQFSVNLKLYPGNPNEKALLRIIEKTFFKGSKYSPKVERQGTIDQILQCEEEQYQEELKRKLTDMTEVTFSVSDMLRGKCYFTSVRDIILTVQEIKKYCSQDSDLRIIEIDSRFQNTIPISDVTLKIVIDEKIVTELQLTLQTNAAAYFFAHIVYEIDRAEIFTKCKMVDNMFTENEQQASELMNRALSSDVKSEIPQKSHNTLREAFGVQTKHPKTWQQAIGMAIETNQTLKASPALRAQLREEAGQLMITVIGLQNPKIHREQFQQVVQRALYDQHLSVLTKSVILHEVFLRLDLAADLKSGFYTDLWQYVQDTLNIQVITLMEIAYSSSIMHFYIGELSETKVENHTIVNPDATVAHSCIAGPGRALDHQLRLLIQLVDAMAHIQCHRLEEYAQKLLELLHKEGKNSQYRKHESRVRLRIYESTIYQQKVDQGLQQQFKDIRLQLVKQEALLVEWQVWNTALNLIVNVKNGDKSAYEHYKNDYEKAVNLSKISLLNLHTPENATAHWLIAQKLEAIQGHNNDQKIIRQACQVHYENIMRCGITPKMATKFNFGGLLSRFPQLQKHIQPNQTLTQMVYQDKPLKKEDLASLVKVPWPNLSTLMLNKSSINEKDSEKICQAQWPSVSALNLNSNKINDRCCEFFSQANWPQLTSLELGWNWQISEVGCKWFSSANWPNLVTLDLNGNRIGDNGCKWLSKAAWPWLDRLELDGNGITEKGCESLCSANWPHINMINISSNPIGPKGCEAMSRANWKEFHTLFVGNCKIGDEGLKWLSQTQWPNFIRLYTGENGITDQGCRFLSETKWPRLQLLVIPSNQFGDEGLKFLCKAQWPRFNEVHVKGNKITIDQGQIKGMFFAKKQIHVVM